MGKQKKQDKATDVIGITSNKTHAAESIQKNRKKIKHKGKMSLRVRLTQFRIKELVLILKQMPNVIIF